MSLSKWHILSLSKAEFLDDIKWVTVFGPSGNEAILVTQSNELYAIGTNGNCCLGLGTPITPGFTPKRIESLKGLNISSIAYGSDPHVLALTEDGTIYAWGANGYGQLGRGSTSVHSNLPKPVNHALGGVIVSKVACGGFHSLALSNKGDVYSWGFNNCGQLGCGDTTSRYNPNRVTGLLDGKTCIHVTCNHTSSFALTGEGEILSWGQNGSGQLGIGSTLQQLQPVNVQINDAFIDQIVTGYSHALALSECGSIYAWGANTHGQLGNASKQCVSSPTIINNIGRASEVAAIHLSHISAATISGKVYIWGECCHQNVCAPLVTDFNSIDEVFACLSSPSCSWRPFMNILPKKDLSSCIENRFNDKETSDMVFIVEGNHIYVHRVILRMRCAYFYSMLQNGKWKESEMDTFEINDYPYHIFKAFVSYFYTDNVDLPNEDIPDLLELSDCYCETELKKKCELLLKRTISVENAIALYTIALRYQAKELQECSFRYITRHCSAVILSKDFIGMEESISKKLLVSLAEAGVFKS
ncbi:PREDICTED: RCC1 and BTB domain-containing protein 1-like [Amphimedon queenslandica]|uniref:BTB domain-containing protein n=1 Tax=Amphimedon queenslandica TaxID=400682 RepID=A0A1X7VM43_AMPQE|nr:PREDICTED: RCC1 and BTB domain-containing protein 1-like [Amphimedon queenslandica]|eukprot:XP_003383757.1 PREDICTED: RCC1 and BTB domain-containing protein 1-like [Amphimedon queenslandica]